jgi:hypothetical protein
MWSGWVSGAGVIACADVAMAKARQAAAINLIILFLSFSMSTKKNTDGIMNTCWIAIHRFIVTGHRRNPPRLACVRHTSIERYAG